jgi:hypothetical protein
MNRTLLIILLIVPLLNCSNNSLPPNDLIDEEQYINLMIELQLVRSFTENSRVDSLTADSLTKEVLLQYDVTADQFMRSHRYYEESPEQQKERVEKALDQLKMDRVEEATDTSAVK